MRYLRVFGYVLLNLVLLLSISCGGHKVKAGLSAEERLAVAKKMFEDEDYLDAKQQLTIFTLSHRGSALADEAQFLLAECHFELKEYILAIDEYQRLIKSYPNSEFVDDAQYKIGMSYFELSPGSGLDQKYAQQAIQNFQRFLEDYPDSPLKPKVEASLTACRKKLAKKEFDSGNLYRKMGYWESALIYLDSVLNSYYDTKYAEKALYYKGECLQKLGRYEEAQKTFFDFVERYPQSSSVEKVRKKLEQIKSTLLSNRTDQGKP